MLSPWLTLVLSLATPSTAPSQPVSSDLPAALDGVVVYRDTVTGRPSADPLADSPALASFSPSAVDAVDVTQYRTAAGGWGAAVPESLMSVSLALPGADVPTVVCVDGEDAAAALLESRPRLDTRGLEIE